MGGPDKKEPLICGVCGQPIKECEFDFFGEPGSVKHASPALCIGLLCSQLRFVESKYETLLNSAIRLRRANQKAMKIKRELDKAATKVGGFLVTEGEEFNAARREWWEIGAKYHQAVEEVMWFVYNLAGAMGEYGWERDGGENGQ